MSPLHNWIGDRIGCTASGFSREHLESYQRKKLKEVLSFVLARSPFYKSFYANIQKNIQSLADIAFFPLTTSEDIRKNPGSFVCVSQDDIQRIVNLPTSGTTGESKRIFFTKEDLELTIDFFSVGMSTLTKTGDRILILLPGQRPDSVGDLLKRGLERLGCSATIYGPVDDEEKVLKTIIKTGANILVGSPVHLHRLARFHEKKRVLPKNQIQKVLASTDTLSQVVRDNIMSILGCDVFDHYGLTETGLGGGVECENHHGFHLREADLFVEIVDPRSELPLPDGEYGEVVVTTLTRTGMPLIRYRTGDQSRLIADTCACGSFIKRLDKITSRINAGIHLQTGLVTQADLDEALFTNRDVIDFSASYDETDGKQELKLAIWTDKNKLEKIEKNLRDCLMSIPTLKIEIASGRHILELIPMDKPKQENPNAMYKRKILVEDNQIRKKH
jgi:phenylacetate-CoA ligase